ncbi:uncharacterized protein PpBr36_06040 [Pyricularia pennisetigena]|uniref:uncharacterized protein n=1 Tax=Pyricularia pennisetigena TaxID=1578925 RepID=UPI0011508508|nr:uncharacterized protein PpBr36_06040 [Pyricularia pennisetigena]TLS22602.1 hypothetical protein PpBr36_06040 [Pyricularia pennisetigena]
MATTLLGLYGMKFVDASLSKDDVFAPQVYSKGGSLLGYPNIPYNDAVFSCTWRTRPAEGMSSQLEKWPRCTEPSPSHSTHAGGGGRTDESDQKTSPDSSIPPLLRRPHSPMAFPPGGYLSGLSIAIGDDTILAVSDQATRDEYLYNCRYYGYLAMYDHSRFTAFLHLKGRT